MQNLGILNNQYDILEKKPYGGYTKNYLGRHNQTQVNYFISIKKRDHNGNDNFHANEINVLNILHYVNNPYIVHFIENGNGILALNNKPPRNVNYLVFEYVPGFILFDYLYEEKFTERQAKLLFRKILNGVQAIHSANICLRNIRPENIIIDGNYNPKIYDFGLSSIYANNLNDYYLGTSDYIAPEILEKHPYDGFKADIFSLGKLLFLLVIKLPHADNKLFSLFRNKQLNKFWNIIRLSNENLSNEFIELFMKMITYDPLQRPTIAQILNDPWMNELNNLTNNELDVLENELRNELHNIEEQINDNLLGEEQINITNLLGEE